ncbi:MAG: hypothetical protein NTY38_03585 [Acidobacteria bacterium]|nr:hypothetical protein [Acidobacteriota bacterium]
MSFGEWLETNIEEGRQLIGSGIQGADSARKTALVKQPELLHDAAGSWKLAVVGACLGAAAGYFSDQSHARRNAAVGGLLGAALGMSGGFAWAGRHLAGAMAQGAIKSVSNVRDEHWLEHNPIAYGD